MLFYAVKIGILNVIEFATELPASSSCLGTFFDPYSSFSKLPIFTLSPHIVGFLNLCYVKILMDF